MIRTIFLRKNAKGSYSSMPTSPSALPLGGIVAICSTSPYTKNSNQPQACSTGQGETFTWRMRNRLLSKSTPRSLRLSTTSSRET